MNILEKFPLSENPIQYEISKNAALQLNIKYVISLRLLGSFNSYKVSVLDSDSRLLFLSNCSSSRSLHGISSFKGKGEASSNYFIALTHIDVYLPSMSAILVRVASKM